MRTSRCSTEWSALRNGPRERKDPRKLEDEECGIGWDACCPMWQGVRGMYAGEYRRTESEHRGSIINN
jgi:hypothetical protein